MLIAEGVAAESCARGSCSVLVECLTVSGSGLRVRGSGLGRCVLRGALAVPADCRFEEPPYRHRDARIHPPQAAPRYFTHSRCMLELHWHCRRIPHRRFGLPLPAAQRSPRALAPRHGTEPASRNSESRVGFPQTADPFFGVCSS